MMNNHRLMASLTRGYKSKYRTGPYGLKCACCRPAMSKEVQKRFIRRKQKQVDRELK